MSLVKEAMKSTIPENIPFGDLPASTPRGRGPIVTWNPTTAAPWQGHADRAKEIAIAHGMGSETANIVSDRHNHSLAINAIAASAGL